MIRSIVVPLDGSPFGEHALPYALTIARHTRAAVRIVHAHAPQDPSHPDWYLPAAQQSDPSAMKFQTTYLEGIAAKITAAGVAAAMAVVEGTTIYALCEHVQSTNADMVVMATHGRGPVSRFWLGSVADGLVRRLTVPLVLVRPKEGPVNLAEQVDLRHILIPLDGSRHAEAILGPALALGTSGVALTLLRVVEPVPVLGYDVFGYVPAGMDVALVDRLRQQAAEYLDGVAARLRSQGLQVRTKVLLNPSAASAILTQAEQEPENLVALETHGRSGPSRLLLGSVADKVLRGAVTPILVHRSSET